MDQLRAGRVRKLLGQLSPTDKGDEDERGSDATRSAVAPAGAPAGTPGAPPQGAQANGQNAGPPPPTKRKKKGDDEDTYLDPTHAVPMT